MNSDTCSGCTPSPNARAGMYRKKGSHATARMKSGGFDFPPGPASAGAMMLFCMSTCSFCVIRVGKARRVCTARKWSVVTDPLANSGARMFAAATAS